MEAQKATHTFFQVRCAARDHAAREHQCATRTFVGLTSHLPACCCCCRCCVSSIQVSGRRPPLEHDDSHRAVAAAASVDGVPAADPPSGSQVHVSRAWHGHAGPRATSATRTRRAPPGGGYTVAAESRPAAPSGGFVRRANPKNALRLLSVASDMAAVIEVSQRAAHLARVVRDLEYAEESAAAAAAQDASSRDTVIVHQWVKPPVVTVGAHSLPTWNWSNPASPRHGPGAAPIALAAHTATTPAQAQQVHSQARGHSRSRTSHVIRMQGEWPHPPPAASPRAAAPATAATPLAAGQMNPNHPHAAHIAVQAAVSGVNYVPTPSSPVTSHRPVAPGTTQPNRDTGVNKPGPASRLLSFHAPPPTAPYQFTTPIYARQNTATVAPRAVLAAAAAAASANATLDPITATTTAATTATSKSARHHPPHQAHSQQVPGSPSVSSLPSSLSASISTLSSASSSVVSSVVNSRTASPVSMALMSDLRLSPLAPPMPPPAQHASEQEEEAGDEEEESAAAHGSAATSNATAAPVQVAPVASSLDLHASTTTEEDRTLASAPLSEDATLDSALAPAVDDQTFDDAPLADNVDAASLDPEDGAHEDEDADRSDVGDADPVEEEADSTPSAVVEPSQESDAALQHIEPINSLLTIDQSSSVVVGHQEATTEVSGASVVAPGTSATASSPVTDDADAGTHTGTSPTTAAKVAPVASPSVVKSVKVVRQSKGSVVDPGASAASGPATEPPASARSSASSARRPTRRTNNDGTAVVTAAAATPPVTGRRGSRVKESVAGSTAAPTAAASATPALGAKRSSSKKRVKDAHDAAHIGDATNTTSVVSTATVPTVLPTGTTKDDPSESPSSTEPITSSDSVGGTAIASNDAVDIDSSSMPATQASPESSGPLSTVRALSGLTISVPPPQPPTLPPPPHVLALSKPRIEPGISLSPRVRAAAPAPTLSNNAGASLAVRKGKATLVLKVTPGTNEPVMPATAATPRRVAPAVKRSPSVPTGKEAGGFMVGNGVANGGGSSPPTRSQPLSPTIVGGAGTSSASASSRGGSKRPAVILVKMPPSAISASGTTAATTPSPALGPLLPTGISGAVDAADLPRAIGVRSLLAQDSPRVVVEVESARTASPHSPQTPQSPRSPRASRLRFSKARSVPRAMAGGVGGGGGGETLTISISESPASGSGGGLPRPSHPRTLLLEAEEAMRRELRAQLSGSAAADPNQGDGHEYDVNGVLIMPSRSRASSVPAPETIITSADILAEEQARERDRLSQQLSVTGITGVGVAKKLSVFRLELPAEIVPSLSPRPSFSSSLRDSSSFAAPVPFTGDEAAVYEAALAERRARRVEAGLTADGDDAEGVYITEDGRELSAAEAFARGGPGGGPMSPRSVNAFLVSGSGSSAGAGAGSGGGRDFSSVASSGYGSSPGGLTVPGGNSGGGSPYGFVPSPRSRLDLDPSLVRGLGFDRDASSDRDSAGAPLQPRAGWNFGYKDKDQRWVQRVKNELIPEVTNPYRDRVKPQTLVEFLRTLAQQGLPKAWRYTPYKRKPDSLLTPVAYDDDIDANGVENPKRARYREYLRRVAAAVAARVPGAGDNVPSYEDFESDEATAAAIAAAEAQRQRFLDLLALDDENAGDDEDALEDDEDAFDGTRTPPRHPFPSARLLYLPECDLPFDECTDLNCLHYEQRLLHEEFERKLALKAERARLASSKEAAAARREREYQRWLALPEAEREQVLRIKERKLRGAAADANDEEQAKTDGPAGTDTTEGTARTSTATAAAAAAAAAATSATDDAAEKPLPLPLAELVRLQPERFEKLLESKRIGPLSPTSSPSDPPAVAAHLPLLVLVRDFDAPPVLLQGRKLDGGVNSATIAARLRTLGGRARNKLSMEMDAKAAAKIANERNEAQTTTTTDSLQTPGSPSTGTVRKMTPRLMSPALEPQARPDDSMLVPVPFSLAPARTRPSTTTATARPQTASVAADESQR